MPEKIRKYPRTPHIQGSRLQPGDEDLSQIPFSYLKGKHLVVEEKIDGANSGISFDENGTLLLQSRGHYLTGGPKERDYNLLKQWGSVHRDALYAVLGSRYILYGEWMYRKHAVYYDRLPHYFLEFDVLDRQTGTFLSTQRRRELLRGLPICSVPVLAEGEFQTREQLLQLLGPSRYISPAHLDILRETCERLGIDPEPQCAATDKGNTMEGLYIKIEEDSQVVDRMKYVRASFLQDLELPNTDWGNRVLIPNGLSIPVEDIFLSVYPGKE